MTKKQEADAAINEQRFADVPTMEEVAREQAYLREEREYWDRVEAERFFWNEADYWENMHYQGIVSGLS